MGYEQSYWLAGFDLCRQYHFFDGGLKIVIRKHFKKMLLKDPELIEMILGKDDAVRMRECVQVIMEEGNRKPLSERLNAFELLMDLAAQIDNANNVGKMNLWERLWPCLDLEEYDICVSMLWLVATCAQNNPETAEYLVNRHIIPRILELISKDEKGPVTKKALLALSALFQSTENGFNQFTELGGLETFEWIIHRFEKEKEKDSEDDSNNFRTHVLFILSFYISLHGEIPKALLQHENLFTLVKEAHKSEQSKDDCPCPIHLDNSTL